MVEVTPMSKDYRKEVERDIEIYRRTGKLPSDNDVRGNGGFVPSSHLELHEEVFHNKQALESVKDLSSEVKSKLSETQKDVFEMFYEKGFTQNEIATILLTSQANVSKIVRKINYIIRECYGRKD